nr:hypothetical protein [Pyrinomonadaceae bacterium]
EHTGNSNAVPPLPSASGSATPDKAPKRSVEIALNNKSDEAVSRSTKTDRNKTRPVANKTPKPVSEQPRAVGNKGTPQQLVREAEQKYQAAIVLLGRDVNRSQIDPIALAQFERTLTAIDQAIADTRRAVRASPDDPVAVQYMLSAYAKKVEVLEEMTTARRTP